MFGNLAVNSWVSVGAGRPVTHQVSGSGEVEFQWGTKREGFGMGFESEALREFVKQGTAALQEMDTRFAQEQSQAE